MVVSSCLGVKLGCCGVGGVYDCELSSCCGISVGVSACCCMVGEGGGRFAGVVVAFDDVVLSCCCDDRRRSRCFVVGVRNLIGKNC